MKEFITKTILLLGLFVFLLCCNDKGDQEGIPYDPSKPVILATFFPNSGVISEKIIFEGENFGNDPEKIRVWFNKKQAKVIGSTGTRLYAVCPRLPGDTCTVSVVVDNDSVVSPEKFIYTKTVSISTLTGNGNGSPLITGSLAQSQFQCNYLCVDKDKNIIVVSTTNGGTVLKVNEEQNSVVEVTNNSKSSGITGETAPCVNPATGVVYITARWDPSTQNWSLDPKENWTARNMVADLSDSRWPIGFPPRVGCSYCQADGRVYIPYWNGDAFRLDPATKKMYWCANGLNGDIYGQVFSPKEPYMWYLSFVGDGADPWKHSIVAVNTQTWERTLVAGQGIAGHRDGNSNVARFRSPKQMAFDADGNLYIADSENRCIRMINTEGKVSTVIGKPGISDYKDGTVEEALLTYPTGLAIDNEGTIYIADGNRLRKLSIE